VLQAYWSFFEVFEGRSLSLFLLFASVGLVEESGHLSPANQ